MKIELSARQEKFLEEKFEIKKADIERMSLEDWKKVREDCFEIEADELLDCEGAGGRCDECDSEDYLIASSIIDLPYAAWNV